MNVGHKLCGRLYDEYSGARSDQLPTLSTPSGIEGGWLRGTVELSCEHEPNAIRELIIEILDGDRVVATESVPFQFDTRGNAIVKACANALAKSGCTYQLRASVSGETPVYTGIPHWNKLLECIVPVSIQSN